MNQKQIDLLIPTAMVAAFIFGMLFGSVIA